MILDTRKRHHAPRLLCDGTLRPVCQGVGIENMTEFATSPRHVTCVLCLNKLARMLEDDTAALLRGTYGPALLTPEGRALIRGMAA